jgi:hypothetical protein
MEGRVLGFDNKTNDGAIKGKDGTRYQFTIDSWKSDKDPILDMLVDFEVSEETAVNIFPVKDQDAEDNKIILGIVSLVLTFFLGFIGTLISRLAISKHSFSKSALSIFIHFIITLIALIPVIGWVFYAIGTIFFMAKNYQYVQNPKKESTRRNA